MASTKLSVYYQNTRGLRTKTSLFKRNLLLSSYDIISLTETWLLEGINDCELLDDRYISWTRDRNYLSTKEKLGGGVLLAVRRELAAVERPEWNSSAEDIWITVTLRNKNKFNNTLHICTLYLCKQNLGHSFNTQLHNFSEKLSYIVNSCPRDAFLILGDFNLSNVDWHCVDNTTQPIGMSGESQIQFFDTLAECDLQQYNLCKNINNRLLDYVLCNRNVSVLQCEDPLVPEDTHHYSLYITLNFTNENILNIKPRLKYFYEKADFSAIKASLDKIDWNNILHGIPLDIATNIFYQKLYIIRDEFIPHKLVNNSCYPPWYSVSLKKLLKEKFKCFRKYKKYGNTADYAAFRLLRKRAKLMEQTCYKNYINQTENLISKQPKRFWSFIKSNHLNSNNIPSTIFYEEHAADTGEDICDLFATYFNSTFLTSSNNDNSSSSKPYADNPSQCISEVEIREDTVYELLNTVDLAKGAGPDQIIPLFIVKCIDQLTKPLTILFNRSITEGVVPKIWKSAFITPVYKSGAKNCVKNYRPISKLCIFAKLFEKIIYNQVYNALSSTFISEQHGFLKKRSTMSNLLTFTDYITWGMDSGGQVDAIFTDFSKAFDRIDHQILLQKLHFAGIHGNLFRWFSSYVENRSQAVVINGYSSRWFAVSSGVPQGSLLGPLLFNIFINDVSGCFKYSKFLLYADDMKIFKTINNNRDFINLQHDLTSFEKYCADNKLDLNVKKCYVISFTRRSKQQSYKYLLKGLELQRVKEIRDLGVIHDSKLAYGMHIDHIVKKANKVLGFILRTSSQFSSLKVVKVLYCSFVRSILEYGSQIWNPQYNVYISRIEAVQRKFLRFLQFKCKSHDNDYEARCRRQHILPLYERRNIGDVVFLSKICQSSVDSPYLLSKINIKIPNRSCRYPVALDIACSASNYRSNSFLIRSARLYNKLVDCSEFDLFNTKPNTFRNKLSKNWFEGSPTVLTCFGE